MATVLPKDLQELQTTLLVNHDIQLGAMLEQRYGHKIPDREKQLIEGLTLDILLKNKAMDLRPDDPRFADLVRERCEMALKVGEAAANYFEMKLLEKECQKLMEKIADPLLDKSEKKELALELQAKLVKLNRFVPEAKRNPSITRDLNSPDFAERLVAKITQGKFNLKDDPTAAKDNTAAVTAKNTNDPDKGMDFAEETNELLLGVANPGKSSNPIIVSRIIPNSSGIVDTNVADKANALYQDNEAEEDRKTEDNTYTSPTPLSMKPKNPFGQ